MYRVGAVSFLNSRPLIAGLEREPDVRLLYDVPARLPERLDRGEVDVALIPIIDVLRGPGRYAVVSDACIACDGETMTVRVFAQRPPHRVTRLHVDRDSHTSVALARLLWRDLFEQDLDVQTVDAVRDPIDAHEAVLLIGDKVVDPRRAGFAYEVDLGGAWKQMTGSPFVFAVWATSRHEGAKARRHEDAVAAGAPAGRGSATDLAALSALLSAARDRGVAQAEQIARIEGPQHGWTEMQAVTYLTRCLKFRMDARFIEGANLFARMCAEGGIVSGDAAIRWADEFANCAAADPRVGRGRVVEQATAEQGLGRER